MFENFKVVGSSRSRAADNEIGVLRLHRERGQSVLSLQVNKDTFVAVFGESNEDDLRVNVLVSKDEGKLAVVAGRTGKAVRVKGGRVVIRLGQLSTEAAEDTQSWESIQLAFEKSEKGHPSYVEGADPSYILFSLSTEAAAKLEGI